MLRRSILAGWPLVLLAALVGGIGGYLFVFGGDPTYSARATLYVAPPTSSSPTDAVMGDQYAANRTQLYLELAQSDELAQRVAAQLQASQPPDVLASRVSATGSHDAPLLMIDATGPTPEDAVELAKAYQDQFPQYARSVEQGSGLREGPVLIAVAGPVESGGATAGWKAWLPVAVPAALLGASMLAFVAWYRQRHPRAGNLGALRDALPMAFVEPATSDPDCLARIQAMLFAGPNSARTVIFASARKSDGLESFSSALADAFQREDMYFQHARAETHDPLRKGLHSLEIFVLDAPALLDESHRIAALAAHAKTAVIIADGGSTSVDDVVELARLLGLNGIDVSGVLSVARCRGRRASDDAADGSDDRPWPAIEVLEDAAGPRRVRRPPTVVEGR